MYHMRCMACRRQSTAIQSRMQSLHLPQSRRRHLRSSSAGIPTRSLMGMINTSTAAAKMVAAGPHLLARCYPGIAAAGQSLPAKACHLRKLDGVCSMGFHLYCCRSGHEPIDIMGPCLPTSQERGCRMHASDLIEIASWQIDIQVEMAWTGCSCLLCSHGCHPEVLAPTWPALLHADLRSR